MGSPFAAVIIAAVASLIAPSEAVATSASTHTSGAAAKCRTQTYSWTRGKKHALNSTKGPKHRSGSTSLTDNVVLAQYQADGEAQYVNITVDATPTGGRATRLETVTIYPAKGGHKHFKIVRKSSKDYVYKYDLLKDYEQVQLPVGGSTSQGRQTTRLKRVVVRARESCFAAQ